jgi:lysophospholipase-2
MASKAFVVEPQACHKHTHTVIFLHGRDSTNDEVANELFESEVSVGYRDAKEDQRTLPALLPTIRWVFPAAALLKSERFGIDMSQWFDMWSVENPEERPELQEGGLRRSVRAISEVIRAEEALVPRQNIFLAGISQGFATALATFLADGRGGFAGLVGLCSWMPCAAVDAPMADTAALKSTPIFLSHASDDDVVPVENGKRMRDVLAGGLQLDVYFHDYPDGGHWVNEPQGVEDMVDFISKQMDILSHMENS